MISGAFRRLVALVALATVLAAALAGPAHGQTDPVDESTTTTAPPTSTTDPSQAGTGDAPSEAVPEVPDTVPPREAPEGSGAEAVAPPPGRVVRVDLRGARASALARQAAWEEAVTRRTALEDTLARLTAEIDRLESASRQAVLDLAQAKADLRDRAVAAYVRGNGDDVIDLDLGDETANGQRATLMSAVIDRDHAAVERVRQLQAKLSADQARTEQALTDTTSQLEFARIDEAQAEVDLFDAKLDLAVSSAGGSIVIHGFVFPVDDPHTFVEDFGDPRLPGTEFEHVHEGCDVVAPEGTELYAAERGVITSISSSLLGGQGLWLKGESGTYYYYAHLSAYAPNLVKGQVVEAGDLVGFVGHTGDAFGPHLHFEVHPGGGSAIDPYPILLVADEQRRSTQP